MSRVKSLDGPRISSVGKEKIYGGKDLLTSQYWASKRRCKRWLWRRWRWWTAICV